jgi:hypothetical protein
VADAWSDWPALQPAAALPRWIEYRRAVWGKFHGSGEDFGWIARSAGFGGDRIAIEGCLALGNEDHEGAPVAFWRVVDDRGFAIQAYPSHAVDLAGRRGLEKQFLEGTAADAPRAAVAAALLPVAAGLATPALDRAATLAQGGGAVPLPLTDAEVAPGLSAAASAGISGIRTRVTQEALVDFYDALLSDVRPAVLRSPAPLPAESLAALLLPLDRAVADRVSIAGWIVSSRFDPGLMRAAWDAIVFETVPRAFVASQPRRCRERAELIVSALLAGDPRRLAAADPAPPGTARTAPAAVPPVVRELIEFARSRDRGGHFPVVSRVAITEPARQELRAALSSLRQQLSASPQLDGVLLDARRRHLQHKADVIRDAALKLDPSLHTLDWTIR